MALKYDLILLHGPPFSCQDVYIRQNLAKSHERVCPEEMFQTDSSLGLRDVALHVTRMLREEPTKTIALVKINPRYGVSQSLWCREHHLAVDEIEPHPVKENISQWFDTDQPSKISYHIFDEPKETEGFNIFAEDMPLTVYTVSKFETPALMIQWEGMIQYSNDSLRLHSPVVKICQEWANANRDGHIILIRYGHNSKASSPQDREDIEVIRTQLAEKIDSCPVFYIHVLSNLKSSHFAQPPKPGIFAFLQKRHCIDLFSKRTVYLYHSPDHLKMAECCGVHAIKMSRVLLKPSLVLSSHIMSNPLIPKYLENMVLVPESESNGCSPNLPLADQRDKIKDGTLSKNLGNARIEYLFAKDREQIDKFQEIFQQRNSFLHTSITLADELKNTHRETSIEDYRLNQSHSDSIREIPSWMLGRTASSSTSKSTSSKNDCSRSDDLGVRQTVYVMSEKELKEMAKDILKQAGREDILQKVSTMRSQELASSFSSCSLQSDISSPLAETKITEDITDTTISEPINAECDAGQRHDQEQESSTFHRKCTDILDDLMMETEIRKKSPKKGKKYRQQESDMCHSADIGLATGNTSKQCEVESGKVRKRLDPESSGLTFREHETVSPHKYKRISEMAAENIVKKNKPDLSILDDMFL